MEPPVIPLSSVTESSQHFRFSDLPSELRVTIYELILLLPKPIDLDPTNCRNIAPRLRLFLVSHGVHEEAYRIFYGGNTFRLFPLHGRFFHTKLLLLSRLPPRYRAAITTVELRLGPGWTAPPKGWVIDGRLGFSDTGALRVLKIFVECDPASDDIFKGFRIGHDFYTVFCRELVRKTFVHVPSLAEVQFDAYPSVSKDSPLMQELLREAKINKKTITWGSERGWGNTQDSERLIAAPL